jgi:hypothetical protein
MRGIRAAVSVEQVRRPNRSKLITIPGMPKLRMPKWKACSSAPLIQATQFLRVFQFLRIATSLFSLHRSRDLNEVLALPGPMILAEPVFVSDSCLDYGILSPEMKRTRLVRFLISYNFQLKGGGLFITVLSCGMQSARSSHGYSANPIHDLVKHLFRKEEQINFFYRI